MEKVGGTNVSSTLQRVLGAEQHPNATMNNLNCDLALFPGSPPLARNYCMTFELALAPYYCMTFELALARCECEFKGHAIIARKGGSLGTRLIVTHVQSLLCTFQFSHNCILTGQTVYTTTPPRRTTGQDTGKSVLDTYTPYYTGNCNM